jgi:pimeloyl-CoA synthetase
LYADDLKRNITLLEKEKLEKDNSIEKQLEDLKKDKETLHDFMRIKDETIKENLDKIKQLTKKQVEFKTQLTTQKLKYEN